MAPADHAYRVRPASAADLPAVLGILAENRAERPHGTALATGEPSDCQPTAFIEAVVVRYAHRRRGVATLLLQKALTDARAASCRKIQLLSHKRHSDDGALHLYHALGFTPEAGGFRLYLDP